MPINKYNNTIVNLTNVNYPGRSIFSATNSPLELSPVRTDIKNGNFFDQNTPQPQPTSN
jgi:hypothetical protein